MYIYIFVYVCMYTYMFIHRGYPFTPILTCSDSSGIKLQCPELLAMLDETCDEFEWFEFELFDMFENVETRLGTRRRELLGEGRLNGQQPGVTCPARFPGNE